MENQERSDIQNLQQSNQPYDYLIIGGGMGAHYAAKGIREYDQTGSIGILSMDVDAPYKRPPLSKDLWTDKKFTQEKVSLHTEKTGADIRLNTKVTAIDRSRKTVQLEDGTVVSYNKLLLATGSEPRKIEGPEDDRAIFFRTWEDYRRLRKFAGNNNHIIVVGGGFIGTELAAGLIQNDTRVTLVYPDEVLGSKRFPEKVAQEYEEAFRDAGVQLMNGKRASSYRKEEEKIIVTLDDGTEIEGDAFVSGLGAPPRISLAEESGLKVEHGGVVVDKYLRTEDPAVYAAGDIAIYPDNILGTNRIEHEDHAIKSGKAVGKVMAGADEPYTYTPSFYSVVFDISWDAIGAMDSRLDTLIDKVGDGKVIYYLKDNKPVGILVWNILADLDNVRRVLKNPPSNPDDLRGAVQEK